MVALADLGSSMLMVDLVDPGSSILPSCPGLLRNPSCPPHGVAPLPPPLRACLEFLKVSGQQPHVLQLHDWHAAAASMLFWEIYQSQVWPCGRACVHAGTQHARFRARTEGGGARRAQGGGFA